MPIAFITNISAVSGHVTVPAGYSSACIQFGTELNLEEIARKLIHVRPREDVILMHGDALISAACVAVWLAMYGRVVIYSEGHHEPSVTLSLPSISSLIAKAEDEVQDAPAV